MKTWIALAALAVASPALAEPFVWLDTDRGPIIIELDPVRAPGTVAHFLNLVNNGFYDNLIFHRTVKDFVAQAGRIDGNGAIRLPTPNPTVDSERNNGLSNVAGTVAIALPAGNPNGGTTEFFISNVNNKHLDPEFTVFGNVVYGRPTAKAIGDSITYQTQTPYRPALIRRAVEADGFPLMPLHTGSWFDPANSGRGFSLEVSTVPGGDGTPLLVVYWYDHHEGRQIWMNGAVEFEYGASEVTVPLQIAEGGRFGAEYDPTEVSFDQAFGTLKVSFSGCAAGSFEYSTKYGNGTVPVERLTIPDGGVCLPN